MHSDMSKARTTEGASAGNRQLAPLPASSLIRGRARARIFYSKRLNVVAVYEYWSVGGALVRRIAVGVVVLLVLAGAMVIPAMRYRVVALLRPEPPPRITPLALARPSAAATIEAQATAAPTATMTPTVVPTLTVGSNQATLQPEPTSVPTVAPTSVPTAESTPAKVEAHGRLFDAYIPAATKDKQFFQYSCEFDAAWVILATYGINASSDELVSKIRHDRSVEPYIKETRNGLLIYGGDITQAYSGDYTKNFLARSTGPAFAGLFEQYGLQTAPVRDRSALEGALRQGSLVWMKTTVDFNKWRPATWIMPDGQTYQTVLGNDHAVVAIGYSERGVVIRDVLGPTSTNRQRPYEYEVDWDTFMAAWGAQSFDGLAVVPPQQQ